MTHGRPRASLAGAALAALLAAGCGDRIPPTIELRRVIPGSGPANERVPVVIEGKGFLPLLQVDYQRPEASKVGSGYSATLADTALEELALEGEEHLSGVVPSGITEGLLELRVVDPWGREAVLSGAYLSMGVSSDSGAADGGADAGAPDAGSDAGELDAGADAGEPDAGLDAGSPDAGSDAGSPDAGADAGAVDAGTDGGSSDAGADAGEATTLLIDPFADGTPASFVFAHDGKIYVGPNQTGFGAVSFFPDGSGPQTSSFAFARDSTGNNTSSNSSVAPYPSLGSTGCTANTSECGPDNENGRGLFFTTTFADAGWIGAAGARTAQSFAYVYLSPDTDPVLDFRYVDLSNFLGAGTVQITSAATLGGRTYLGFGGTAGAKRPGLVALTSAPPAPGLDPTTEVLDLVIDKMPSISNGGGAANNIKVDAMAVFNNRLYLGAYGGWVRSTTATPASYQSTPADWADCAPTAAGYAARVSTTTTKRGGLEPADHAVPGFAAFAGRLYAARNTTAGPQLWACDPALTAPAADCDSADWTLVAPNSVGDLQLTQFNDPANSAITLLLATPTHLYVGFNNATRGAVVMRSAASAPTAVADFTGKRDCSATNYPSTCDGYGGAGLGNGQPSSRIFHSIAEPYGGADHLFVLVGNGTSPLRVVRVGP